METNIRYSDDHGQDEILNRSVIPDDYHIDARITSHPSLFDQSRQNGVLSQHDNTLPNVSKVNQPDYTMMIKYIQESMQGLQHWKALFANDKAIHLNESCSIPTMSSIVIQAMQDDETKLDEKQLVTYEAICSTFLLALINDGDDETTPLGSYFATAAQSANTVETCHTSDDYSSSINSSSDKILIPSFSALVNLEPEFSPTTK